MEKIKKLIIVFKDKQQLVVKDVEEYQIEKKEEKLMINLSGKRTDYLINYEQVLYIQEEK